MQNYRSTYRVFALMMAFLVLCSSTGIAMDLHYCQGEFKSFSILGKAKTCHEIARQQATCPHHPVQKDQGCNSESEKKCCDNEVLYVQSDQDQQISSATIGLTKPDQQFLLACYFILFADRYRLIADQRGAVPDYFAPLIARDISVLFETFLL